MGDRGLFVCGDEEAVSDKTIDYITISTTGNATDFGDSISNRVHCSATSNGENDRCVYSGLEYVTISTTGNGTTFGNLSVTRDLISATSNAENERGVFGGGFGSGPSTLNTIDYITINSTGNATDFGDLTVARYYSAATSNARGNRGVFAGGREYSSPPSYNTIDYITISTTGNATDFGDLTDTITHLGGTSNASGNRGVFAGGASSSTDWENTISYITISTTGNATDFGDLTVGRHGIGGTSNARDNRGVFAGGAISGVLYNNTIDYITISTTGNANDFGDLTVARVYPGGASNAKTFEPKASHWQGGVSIDSMRYMYTFDRLDTDPTITHLESGGMELPEYE